LPIRGLLFVTLPSAVPLVMMQVLDGVSATVVGLMTPLMAADLTRKTGYLNFAISSLGLAAGIGATFSTTAAGWMADTAGPRTAFFCLAIVGFAAVALIWLLMPETRPVKRLAEPPATALA
jgi:MFS family permease